MNRAHHAEAGQENPGKLLFHAVAPIRALSQGSGCSALRLLTPTIWHILISPHSFADTLVKGSLQDQTTAPCQAPTHSDRKDAASGMPAYASPHKLKIFRLFKYCSSLLNKLSLSFYQVKITKAYEA
jgi:hypothetical protein